MQNSSREQLIKLISQYGCSIVNEFSRCESLILDLCGQQKLDVNLLLIALKQNIPSDLLKLNEKTHLDLIINRLTSRLSKSYGILEENARWAVESWTLALGMISLAQCKINEPIEQVLPSKEDFAKGEKNQW